MKLLLHTCCAPCSVYCIDTLREEGIEPVVYWFNPNIHPYMEYKSRRDCLKEYTSSIGVEAIFEENYGLREFCKNVINDLDNRCVNYCYRVRMEQTAKFAKENGYDAFSTTLLVSPYQKHDELKKVCEEMAKKYGIQFIYRDFRVGFRKGQAKARELGLYMQKYCGCVFSEEDRYYCRNICMNQLSEKYNERNYGIDFLRIVSMIFVVILHCFGHGGILNNVSENSVQYKASWLLEIITYCAVDIFALISGYVGFRNEDSEKSSSRYSRYLKLWLQVVFYGIGITGIFNIIMPDKINLSNYLVQLFPVTNNLWWYFTAYTGLFIIMPIINNGIRASSEENCKKIFILIIIFYSIYAVISNTFNLNGGYSVIWLIILYILGSIIKKCNINKKIKWYTALITIIGLILITYIFMLYGKDFNFFEIQITKKLFISYVSPTILISAIMYLILFSNIKFNKKIEKIIKFAASSSFAIYIINEHSLMKENIMVNNFVDLATCSIFKIYLFVIGFAVVFAICAILIDKFRMFIFKILHVDDLSKIIVNSVEKIFTNNIHKIYKL